jgi:hypothetical protein
LNSAQDHSSFLTFDDSLQLSADLVAPAKGSLRINIDENGEPVGGGWGLGRGYGADASVSATSSETIFYMFPNLAPL